MEVKYTSTMMTKTLYVSTTYDNTLMENKHYSLKQVWSLGLKENNRLMMKENEVVPCNDSLTWCYFLARESACYVSVINEIKHAYQKDDTLIFFNILM
jgi:hypothetical protein